MIQQKFLVTLVIDTVNVIFESVQGTIQKLDLNLRQFLDQIRDSNIEIYILAQNNQENQVLIFDQAQFPKSKTFFIDSDSNLPNLFKELQDICQREIFLISENPLDFVKLHKSFIDASFILFNQTEQNLVKKEDIETKFYEFAIENPGKVLHISSLIQLLPYIRDQQMNGITPSKTMVGYHLYPKKVHDLINQQILFDTDKILFVPMDLRYLNQTQIRQLNVVIHKNIDFNKGRVDLLDQSQLENIDKNFNFLGIIKKDLKIIDRMEQIGIVQSRVQFQKVFEYIIKISYSEVKQYQLCTPQIVQFENNGGSLPNGIIYPIIIKTEAACSAKFSHTMGLVVSQKGLEAALQQECFKGPLVFQQLVQHNGVIFKIYVIGKGVQIQVRGSLPNIEEYNFLPKTGFFIFDSQKNLVDQFSSCLKVVAEPNLELKQHLLAGVQQFAQGLSKDLSNKLNFSLYGYDLIMERNTNKLYIIDINYFPGFKNIENVVALFHELIQEKA